MLSDGYGPAEADNLADGGRPKNPFPRDVLINIINEIGMVRPMRKTMLAAIS